MRYFAGRPAVASVTLVVAAGLAVGGCGSTSSPSTAGCASTGVQPAASGAAAGWTLPGVVHTAGWPGCWTWRRPASTADHILAAADRLRQQPGNRTALKA
jgi:hypothetical protein